MKVIIAGSRTINNYKAILDAVSLSKLDISEVVSGGASGVDSTGKHWADLHNIPVKRFPANWEFYGKSAGFIRNGEMAEYADALILVWDGESKGSKHMLAAMRRRKKPIYEMIVRI